MQTMTSRSKALADVILRAYVYIISKYITVENWAKSDLSNKPSNDRRLRKLSKIAINSFQGLRVGSEKQNLRTLTLLLQDVSSRMFLGYGWPR